jgi:CheY-like chemotaxis protein
METETIYAQTVSNTFRKRALRTVFIVDDQFPNYEDLSDGEEKLSQFTERDRARTLYRAFRKHQIPCDIENRIGNLDEAIEYIRKSDLIVLDYNLAPRDTRQSLGLIRKLSATKHFNTIVLYTQENDLDEVWINVAVSLRGDWKKPETLLAADGDKWSELLDKGVLPSTSAALIKVCIVDPKLQWPKAELEQIVGGLTENGIAIDEHNQDSWIRALVHRDVRERLKDDDEGKSASHQIVCGECKQEGARWIQSGNCFVAILGKHSQVATDGEGRDNGEAEATRIFACLDAALLDWHPSLVQILVSEIQNILELEAFANDEERIRDPHVQLGLLYFMLSSLETGVTHNDLERLMPPLQVVLDKLMETIRHRITTDGELGRLAQQLFAEELKAMEWPLASNSDAEYQKNVFAAAKTMARISGVTSNDDVVFKLNSFLATEPFRGGSVTTGTIFKAVDAEEYWICTSPACDMVVRKPSQSQAWSYALDPMRPIVAVRIEQVDWSKALKVATQGKHVFLQTLDGPKTFVALDTTTGQPSYEFLFIHEGARTTAPSTVGELPSFLASRVQPGPGVKSATDSRILFERAFVVVGQLRPEYASRLLQATGQHLSRLGVDYMKKVAD